MFKDAAIVKQDLCFVRIQCCMVRYCHKSPHHSRFLDWMGRSVLTICSNIVQVSFIVRGLYCCGFIHVHSPVFSWKIVCISPFWGVVLFVGFFSSADTEYWSITFVKWMCRKEETGLPLPEPKREEQLSSMTNISRHPFSASYLV